MEEENRLDLFGLGPDQTDLMMKDLCYSLREVGRQWARISRYYIGYKQEPRGPFESSRSRLRYSVGIMRSVEVDRPHNYSMRGEMIYKMVGHLPNNGFAIELSQNIEGFIEIIATAHEQMRRIADKPIPSEAILNDQDMHNDHQRDLNSIRAERNR